MPDKEDSARKRMVVEEVVVSDPPKQEEKVEVEAKIETEAPKPEILPEAASVVAPEVPSENEVKPIEKEPIAPAQVETKKQKSPVFWILIPGIFLLGAILSGVIFYQKGVSSGQNETPTPTPTSEVSSPTPSASPSATVDLTKYTVTILNGSGIAGEAGKVKTLLTTAGFTVGTTSNAATYDYTSTIIKAKSSVNAAFLAQLSTALGKSYVVGTNQTLATSSANDVEVIVGTSKAE